jgi:hypothetical protein
MKGLAITGVSLLVGAAAAYLLRELYWFAMEEPDGTRRLGAIGSVVLLAFMGGAALSAGVTFHSWACGRLGIEDGDPDPIGGKMTLKETALFGFASGPLAVIGCLGALLPYIIGGMIGFWILRATGCIAS